MKHVLLAALFCLSACATDSPLAQADTCLPSGYDRPKLEALKAAKFEIADSAARQAFARGIVACLASPDPALRDKLAFEALFTLARAKRLDPATMKAITAELYAMMQRKDAAGFAPSFAALTLAEMARADRVEAYLSDAELAAMVERAAAFEAGVTDHRGYDKKEGWRHGVAHGADLLMQLVLNPRVGRDGLIRIRDAVGAQIAPQGHSYIYGESERLVRSILFAARRGLITEVEWSEWLAKVTGPGDLGAWRNAGASQAGLARVHNVKAFAYALWTNVTAGEDASDDVLKPGLLEVLKTLP